MPLSEQRHPHALQRSLPSSYRTTFKTSDNRYTTDTLFAIKVNEAADREDAGDAEVEPWTKKRKGGVNIEEGDKEKQTTSHAVKSQAAFLDSMAQQQAETQRKQFEHDKRLHQMMQECEQRREEREKNIIVDLNLSSGRGTKKRDFNWRENMYSSNGT